LRRRGSATGIGEGGSAVQREDLTRFFQILLQTDDDLRRSPIAGAPGDGIAGLINARAGALEELLAELKERRAGQRDEHRSGAERGTGWASRSICKDRGTGFCGGIPAAAEGGNENAILFPVRCASICASSTVAPSAEVKRAVEAEESGIPAKTNSAPPQRLEFRKSMLRRSSGDSGATEIPGRAVEQSSRGSSTARSCEFIFRRRSGLSRN